MTLKDFLFVTCFIIGAISTVGGVSWLALSLITKKKKGWSVTLIIVGLGLIFAGWALFQNAFSSEYHF